MTTCFSFERRVLAATLVRAECEAVGSGTSGGVGAGDKCHDRAEHDRGFACAICTNERVAVLVIGFHGDGGESQVGAVNTDSGGLSQASTRVGSLYGRVDGHGTDAQDKNKVDLVS